ncbi:hypothetical protein [Burkholderia sp. BE17]|uniref:hypothetical protein n=1 Tax=Burkholderia sp. BE17 TaxID=2656644 RepID=UPI00128C011F|nr:hypothetical protein [Burkholderia sp. BE17]MPV71566.1 hypothetical protein [Burkholderia sp. BE17]
MKTFLNAHWVRAASSTDVGVAHPVHQDLHDMEISYEADALFRGALLGLVCGAAAVPIAGYAIESLTRLPADGWRPVAGGVALVTAVLIAPSVMTLLRAKRLRVPTYDASRLKAALQGRLVGVALGVLFGISFLAR